MTTRKKERPLGDESFPMLSSTAMHLRPPTGDDVQNVSHN